MKSYQEIPRKIHEETDDMVEDKRDGEIEVRFPGCGLSFKLFRFSYLLSMTGLVTSVGTSLLGSGFNLYLYFDEDLCRDVSKFVNRPHYFLFHVTSICLWSTYFWRWMIMESKNEKIVLIEKCVKIYSYASSLMNFILQVTVVLVLALHENQHLKETLANCKVTLALVILAVLTGIIFTCRLIHGLRTKQSGHLKDYIIFRCLLLSFAVILTVVAVTMITIFSGVWWMPLCGLFALSLVCVFSVLDLGPTTILHSIWSQEDKNIRNVENRLPRRHNGELLIRPAVLSV